ncbi:MAG: Dabb family protein [Ostreibacterium sp.]
MIHHVVMWQLKPCQSASEKQQIINEIKVKIEGLKVFIPEIIDLHVGLNINELYDYDIMLFSIFNNEADLASYQGHPEHQKVGKFIKNSVVQRANMDYELIS